MRSESFVEGPLPRTPKDVLTLYYRTLRTADGTGPTASEFFPVKVEELVRSVLGWQVEGVAEIGHIGSCERVRGRCDYPARTIFIAVDAH